MRFRAKSLIEWPNRAIRWFIGSMWALWYGIMLYPVPKNTKILVFRAEDVENAVKLAREIERKDIFDGHIIVVGSKIDVGRIKDAPDELIEAFKKEIRQRS